MPRTLAIIGRGFSGTAVAYELVRQASSPFNILFLDASIYAGKGIAYSTNCPIHLLNVVAEKMSAIEDDSDHLLNWLEADPSWRQLDPSFKTLKIHRTLFLPRMIYGAYLEHISSETKTLAAAKGIGLKFGEGNATDVTLQTNGSLELLTSTNRRYEVHDVILATSVSWTNPIANKIDLEDANLYLPAPWPVLTTVHLTKEWVGTTDSSTEIALIGSGLTMLDAIAALDFAGYKGKIAVISRSGLFPQPHLLTLRGPDPFEESKDFPNSTIAIFRKLRMLSQGKIGTASYDWRAIIDSLRRITPQIWNHLPLKEQKRLLRHLFSHWNHYRHRSPANILEIAKQYQKLGRLQMVKASARSIHSHQNKGLRKVAIEVTDRLADLPYRRSFDRAINCSGPNFHIQSSSNSFIRNLLEKNLASPDLLSLGLKIQDQILVSTIGESRLFAIGALLFGSHFETVAVPELRRQCKSIAKNYCNT